MEIADNFIEGKNEFSETHFQFASKNLNVHFLRNKSSQLKATVCG